MFLFIEARLNRGSNQKKISANGSAEIERRRRGRTSQHQKLERTNERLPKQAAKMALFSFAPQPSSLFSSVSNRNRNRDRELSAAVPAAFLKPTLLSLLPPRGPRRLSASPLTLARSPDAPDAAPEPDSSPGPANVTDEWGEKADPEPEASYSRLSDSDPPREDDEWGGGGGGGGVEGYVAAGNGTPSAQGEAAAAEDRVGDLKRCLADTVYGTDFGFRAGQEVRAEVLELVNQLEAANPTPAPVDATGLLDGKWVLV